MIEVDHHIKHIGSLKRNLFPFSHSENKKYVKSILGNISNWIYKLENDTNDMNDEISYFLNTLKESQAILKNLYAISVIRFIYLIYIFRKIYR